MKELKINGIDFVCTKYGMLKQKQREFAPKPTYEQVVEMLPLGGARTGRTTVNSDRVGSFSRSTGYIGWQKSLYAQAWFDSEPERTVANLLDDDRDITCWVRLQTGDLPILWNDKGSEYNPDFVAVETTEIQWVVEVKADKDMETLTVSGKREAAKRWANHVSSDPLVGRRWEYLLLSESDVHAAKGSWAALKALGSS